MTFQATRLRRNALCFRTFNTEVLGRRETPRAARHGARNRPVPRSVHESRLRNPQCILRLKDRKTASTDSHSRRSLRSLLECSCFAFLVARYRSLLEMRLFPGLLLLSINTLGPGSRQEAITSGEGVDWGTGEALAFGSLLLEGLSSLRVAVFHRGNKDQALRSPLALSSLGLKASLRKC